MKYLLLMIASMLVLTGCSNPHPMGSYVAQVRQEQIYNPNATLENLAVIPTGNGEKMEGIYSTYTGKKGESIDSAKSQVLVGFAK
ncbi:hypothetical protein HUO09_14340 [Vibrio sp. Y2-5]|uniref:hypothetical protein n=1 Tax=Vibrio sp. Y2-5 TaxID=2743977 RepID=UPI0016615D68|nr:hypothetical protein [Vibrio sp. Y2-5]MBD0787526.1 hypothetical protein [Vibrio sp. Y2-5]